MRTTTVVDADPDAVFLQQRDGLGPRERAARSVLKISGMP